MDLCREKQNKNKPNTHNKALLAPSGPDLCAALTAWYPPGGLGPAAEGQDER